MTLTDITDGYSVQLSNPTYTFAGTDSGVDGTQSVTTTVYAMRGSETVACTVNASAIVKPAGMSITSDSASPSPTLTITASSVITTGGVINIPIVVPTNDGDLTYVRQFSYSISKSGVSPTVDISKDEETGTTTIVIVDAVGTHTAEIGDGLNQATVNLYQRGATAPAKPGAMTYTFATGELDGELGNWSPTVPNGDEICWVTTVSAISTGPVDFIQASEWSEPSRFNSSGMNQATLYLYRRGPSVPSISTPMTYDFTTGILSDVPSGWQRSIPSNSSGQACWVTSASVLSRSSTATIAYTSWSTPTKFVEDGSSVFVKSVEKHGTVTTMVIEDASGEHEITINDGEDGDEGVPGKYGYVHTAWANSADGQTDFSTSVSADKKYLGSYTDNTSADSQDPSMYSWSLIKGVGLQSTTTYYALSTSKSTHPPITDKTAWSTTAPEAPYGYYIWMYIETVYDDGKVFNSDPAVISGKTLYTWIKYAKDDQGTGMSDDPTGMDYMGIAYNKDTPVESYVAGDYDWCLYKGDKGIQGPPGTSYYTWIKYADDSEGHGMSDSPVGKKYIGLAHNKDTDVESTTPSDYVWSLIQGENGRAIEKIDEYYKVSSSYTDPPTGTWSKNTPEVMTPTLKFLWNYEVISYNDGSEPTTTAKRVIGAYGENGTDGKGITQIQNWYLATDKSSDVTYNTSGWTTTIQTMTEDNRYLWNYEVTTFSDDSTSRSLPCIIGVYGEKGLDGRSIAGVTNWYKKTQTSTAPSKSESGWSSTTIPVLDSDNPYLWNYEVVTDTNGNTISSTNPTLVGHFGTDGDDGRSITGITEYYAKSSSTTAPADSAFGTSIPVIDATNKYLWNYESITYSSGNPDKTGKRIIGIYGDKGEKGDTGTSVSSTIEQYCLINSGSTPGQYTTWSDTPPTYVQDRVYWTRTVTTYSNGNQTYSTAVKNNALTDSNKNAATALNSANGKNAIFYAKESSTPTATATGDVWYVLGTTTKPSGSPDPPSGQTYNNKIIDVREWSGSSWVSRPLTAASFSFIDAGKITTGQLSTITIKYNDDNYWDLGDGTFKTNKGTFVGSVTANTGYIGGTNGWTIATQQLSSGSIGSSGSLFMATKNLSGTVAGAYRSDWRLTVGSKFGLSSDGTLYAKDFVLSKGELGLDTLYIGSASGGVQYIALTTTSGPVLEIGGSYTWTNIHSSLDVYGNLYVGKERKNDAHGLLSRKTDDYIIYHSSGYVGIRNGQGTIVLDKDLACLRPNTDDGFQLGKASCHWKVIYVTDGVKGTSDEKKKDIIGGLDDYAEDLVMSLKPIEFMWKSGDHRRSRMGFSAQETAKLCKSINKNLAVVSASYTEKEGNDTPTKEYFGEEVDDSLLSWVMDKTELIAPIVKVLQLQNKRIEELEKMIGDKGEL